MWITEIGIVSECIGGWSETAERKKTGRMQRMSLAILAVAILLTCVSSVGSAQGDVRVAARAGIQLRATPALDGTVIESLPSMAKVTVLETLGAWVRVASSSKVGYVRAADLSAPAAVQAAVLRAPPPAVYASQSPFASTIKDPTTSMLISVIVPGGGHFYSGDTKKGAIILGTAIGAPIVGYSIIAGSAGSGSAAGVGAGLLIGSLAALGAWIYGIVDSGPAAHRYNAALGYKTAVVPTLQPMVNGGTGLGLKINIAP